MKKFTGTCTCGHSWDDHHHGVILNPKYLVDTNQEYRNVGGILGEECEAEQLHGIPLCNDPCVCHTYIDIGWDEK